MGLGSGIRDLRSEIRDPEKTYYGSRDQKGTGSRIQIRNTGSKTYPHSDGVNTVADDQLS